jgi:hypothetical protein
MRKLAGIAAGRKKEGIHEHASSRQHLYTADACSSQLQGTCSMVCCMPFRHSHASSSLFSHDHSLTAMLLLLLLPQASTSVALMAMLVLIMGL